MALPPLTLAMPEPPTTNNLLINAPGSGRTKSAAYRLWIFDAARRIRADWNAARVATYGALHPYPDPRQPLFTTPLFERYGLIIRQPANGQRDLDGSLKAVIDLLGMPSRTATNRRGQEFGLGFVAGDRFKNQRALFVGWHAGVDTLITIGAVRDLQIDLADFE